MGSPDDVSGGQRVSRPQRRATITRIDQNHGSSVGSGSQGPSSFARDDTIGTNPGPDDVGNDQPARVDKSTLAVSAPPPLSRQSAPSLYRPTSLPPLWPQAIRPPSPRHLQPRALGRKASDEVAVPLCRIHHRLVHRVGNEAAWWKDASSCPGSSGTTAAWIRGGSRPGRRRNVPSNPSGRANLRQGTTWRPPGTLRALSFATQFACWQREQAG